MGLSWEITDLTGVRLASLIDRRNGRVTIKRNGARDATVTLNLDDPAVLKVSPLQTLLRCYLDGALIFAGRILTPVFSDAAGAGEGGATCQINAIDPSNHLERLFLTSVAAYAATDQSAILSDLISDLDAYGHGIAIGTLDTSGADRDRTYYAGKQIWEAITQMSEVDGGPDFELEPIADDVDHWVRLNTFASQGAARPAIFEYGHGLHNVAGFSYQPDGSAVVTDAWAVGTSTDGLAPAHESRSTDAETIYGGRFQSLESPEDVTDDATLQEYTDARVQAFGGPISYLTLALPPQSAGADEELGEDFTGTAYGEPPVCGPLGDYWIGDTITARIKRTIDVAVSGRVDQLDITEGDSGLVTASPTLTPAVATLATVNTEVATYLVVESST